MQADSVTKASSGRYSESEISRIIQMAWEDRTPFEAIELQFGLNESGVIRLMRSEMKASSFRMWRKRVNARTTKHQALQSVHQKKARPNQRDVEGQSAEG